VSEKYELIDAEKAIYPIVKMCVWLGVARSGFYEWRDRPLLATAEQRAEIPGLVCAVVDEFEERYGSRKIRVELARRGVLIAPPVADDDRPCRLCRSG